MPPNENVQSGPQGTGEAVAHAVTHVAWAMKDKAPGGFSPGEIAAFRRLDPDGAALSGPFWKAFFRYAPEADHDSPRGSRGWAMLLAGMAMLAPDPHERDARLGSVLASAGFHERRFEQLLQARGEQFWPTFRRACAFLAAKGAKVDWVRLWPFLFPEDEESRRRIARDYYATLAKIESKKD